jgi:hypothetical protein
MDVGMDAGRIEMTVLATSSDAVAGTMTAIVIAIGTGTDVGDVGGKAKAIHRLR